MRSIIAAVSLFATAAFALSNADFNPVNFVDEELPALTLNETFATFRWKGDEAFAKESFTINADAAMRIQVTDYKNRGDMFEVFDNGKSLGMTTKVNDNKDNDVFAATPEEALMDDRFSKGIFDLEAGEHKITIKAAGPYEAGTAAIRVLDHSNNAFYKKGGEHGGHGDHDEDDDKDDDEDDKKWHKDGDDDDDDEDDKKWHKDGDDDDEDDKEHGHGGHDDDKEHGHGGHDDDKEHGHGGHGEDEEHGHGGHDDDKEHGHGGHGEDEEHGHGHHDDDKEHGHGGDEGHKWGDKKPTSEEIDFDHTLTFTKTRWVHVAPTQSVEEGGNHWGGHGHEGGYKKHEYYKGGEDDDYHKGGYHKGGDDEHDEGHKGDYHKGGDDEHDDDYHKGDYHKGGDDEHDDEGHKGSYHKGGDDERDDEDHKGNYHKGGDDENCDDKE